MTSDLTNGFTMPGETGYEGRVLELAKEWGADALRDSDGTKLPGAIKSAGYPIYSTVCLIRGENEFAKANLDKLQCVALMSDPVTAEQDELSIDIMAGQRTDWHKLNDSPESIDYWQVFDRTSGEELPRKQWTYSPDKGTIVIHDAKKWHSYTVNFFAWQIWEFINWYNHTVNNWTTEPEFPLDPVYPEVREQLKTSLASWLESNTHTTVVRFTTFYYNNGPGGWGDYGRSVSPKMLEDFRIKNGYKLSLETFINGGNYNPLGRVPSKQYVDYVDFVNEFLIETMKVYVDMIHAAGKKAFFLFGDHWIGCEPQMKNFAALKMDGVVKSVFNGYEVRIGAAAESVPLKEIRFHPYFFPKEVTGKPTLCEEGTPTDDLKQYWIDIRRACLRVHINRIGFGGYVSLADKFPDFIDYITELSSQARHISALHQSGAPYATPINVAVMGHWGKRRAWMVNGHMQHNSIYNQFLESLSGLPVNVEFITFEDILKKGISEHINVLVNCGREGSSWSGGDIWQDPELVNKITEYTATGGALIGIGEPSASSDGDSFFRLAKVLGVDRESVLVENNHVYDLSDVNKHFITQDLDEELDFVTNTANLQIVSERAKVISALKTGECPYFYQYIQPQIITNEFHSGRCVYFSGFKYNAVNTRALCRALYWAAKQESSFDLWQSSNLNAEAAYYPGKNILVVVNNTKEMQKTTVKTAEDQVLEFELKPLEAVFYDLRQ